MRLFLKRLGLFSLTVQMVYAFALFYVYRLQWGTKGAYEVLYDYQFQKIDTAQQVQTVFIGDSSLGNSFDSNLFGQSTGSKTISVALSGLDGYAGSYNMLKRTLRANPGLKNVVLVQTIDMQSRQLSYLGYAHTMQQYNDFSELSITEKIHTLVALGNIKRELLNLIKSATATKRTVANTIEHDYVKQGAKAVDYGKVDKLFVRKITRDKNRFLNKIVALCRLHHINLVYAYGPIWNEVAESSGEYLQLSDEAIRTSGIQLLDTVLHVKETDLGDKHDHIRPNLKKEFTHKYLELLKPYLEL